MRGPSSARASHMAVPPRTTVILFRVLIPLFFAVIPVALFAALSPSERASLEDQLKALDAQIAEQRGILDSRQRQSVSLERDIAILDAKIEQAKLSIKARDLSIQRLTSDIQGKDKTIGTLSAKIEREKESLGQLLRKTNELDSFSVAEFALAKGSLSDFFGDLDTFDQVKQGLKQSFEDLGQAKSDTEEAKQTLEEKKQEELELRKLQQLQKKKIETEEKEKQNILKISRGLEAEYQRALKAKEQSAAFIRSQLFELTGTVAIPFEKAYEYALEVQQKLGVRPAFLLGIIAEESNLGENIGTGNWRIDMHPTRDQPVFKQITAELGLNPDTMPVSKKAWYGWGGAMGPAQFIPSTWIIYKDKIANLTGSRPPNPWNARDAFIASGVLLKDNGAGKGTRAAERLAALRYLAGWTNATKAAYAFYGDDVMDLADMYQRQIDILNR